MRTENSQNIYDICLQNFGDFETLFEDVLIPNKLNLNSDVKVNQEVNLNAFGVGNEDIKNSIKEEGLIFTNAIFEEVFYTTPEIIDYDFLFGTTINAVPTEIFIDGVSGERKKVGLNKSLAFWGEILAKNSIPNASKSWEFAGLIKNETGIVSIVDVTDVVIVAEDTGALTWGITFQADNINKALNIITIGQLGNTIDWECKLYSIEL